ncbi:MAG: hypothetical protein PHF17_01565 [Arcobacteraceae bacterium]|nr:hypothetical protein [Arcobacteraceae bacterium]
MIFDLDNMINKNCEQILKQYLGVDSFENYDVKIQLLSQNDNQRFFDTYFKLTYKLTHLKNHLLVITAKSQSFCIHNFPVSNLNKFKKLFTYNDIDFATINRLQANKQSIESKKYVFSINSKIDTSNTFYILLELEKTELEIQAKRFIKNYLVMYKLKYNMNGWYKKFKYHLLSCYKDEETLPNRDDKAYRKIEGFHPFELTYRIFYEMAIRNCRVKKIMHTLGYLYDLKKVQKDTIITIDDISCEIINEEKVYKIFGAVMGNDISNKTKFFMGVNSFKYQCVEEITENYYEMKLFLDKSNDSVDLDITVGTKDNKFNNKDLDITVGTKDNKFNNKDVEKPLDHCSVSIRSSITEVAETNKKTTITICKGLKKYTIEPKQDGSWSLELDDSTELLDEKIFLKTYIDFLTPEEHQIYLTSGLPIISELINEFEKELEEKYLIHSPYLHKKHSETSYIRNKKICHNHLGNSEYQDKYFAHELAFDGYSVYQGIFKDSDGEFDINIIKQNMTKLVVDKNLSPIQLNLNLPKAELIAYLSKIKDNYDNDNSIIKSPLELFKESFEAKDDIGLASEDRRKNFKTKLTEIADMFFTYDINPFILQRKKALEDEIKVLKIKRDELKSEKTYKLNPDRNVGKPNITPTYRSIKVEYETLIDDCKKDIKRLEEDVKKNNNHIATEIGETADTVKTYNDIMSDYIENKKYIKFLTKT